MRTGTMGVGVSGSREPQHVLHPGLTLTGMYNVLEKLRAFDGARLCEPQRPRTDESPAPHDAKAAGHRPALPELTPKERQIHEQGLVSVLKQIHDDLDAAVFAAYGWDDLVGTRSTASQNFPKSTDGAESVPASKDIDELILERLVALNHERAEEEKRGKIRWLRPEFQCRDRQPESVQTEIAEVGRTVPGEPDKRAGKKPKTKTAKQPWPKTLPAQVEAVQSALEAATAPATVADLAKTFQRANKDRIAEILQTLTALGKAKETGGEHYHRTS